MSSKVQNAEKFIVPITITRQGQIMKASLFIMTVFFTEKTKQIFNRTTRTNRLV